MDYVRLGRAGVKVSRLCLGTAFRGYWRGHTDEAILLTAPTFTIRGAAKNCWARRLRTSAKTW